MIALLALTSLSWAQAPALQPPTPERGLVTTQLTLSPGVSQVRDELNIYLHGDMEIYSSERFGLRGDAYMFVGEQRDRSPLAHNHDLLLGVVWHPLARSFDPYVALQPGLALTQSRDLDHTLTLSPVLSGTVGANLFVLRGWRLFAEGKQVVGRHLGGPEPVSLNELRVSLGLGIQLQPLRWVEG